MLLNIRNLEYQIRFQNLIGKITKDPERVCVILNADRNSVFSGKECMERYSTLNIEKLTIGGTGWKRNLLDVTRFLILLLISVEHIQHGNH